MRAVPPVRAEQVFQRLRTNFLKRRSRQNVDSVVVDESVDGKSAVVASWGRGVTASCPRTARWHAGCSVAVLSVCFNSRFAELDVTPLPVY